MKKRKKREFYSQQTEQSRVKAEIITKYFASRMKIISGTTTKMVYIDLYAGRGRYDDGAESTPLMVLRRAIDDPVVSKSLATIFNDKDHAATLRAEIKALPKVEALQHKPLVYSSEVDAATAKIFADVKMAPTLAFLDPWGYKGLSQDLIHSLVKDWGCEVLFFFNFNRVNMDIDNEVVTKHMKALFGETRLETLRRAVDGQKGAVRERAIMTAVDEMVREAGGHFIVSFRFGADGKERTSHYLIFATKSFIGYKIMRDVMGKASSYDINGVPAFEYTKRPPLFLADGRSIEALADSLAAELAGTTMPVEEIFKRHSRDKLYVMSNYREALLRIEQEGRVTMSPAASDRRLYNGKPSMGDKVRVTFPPRPKAGTTKGTASHPTSVHRAAARPPSVSARPTA